MAKKDEKKLQTEGGKVRAVRKLDPAEKAAEQERRLEIQMLRHLKKKYPDDDLRIDEERSRGN